MLTIQYTALIASVSKCVCNPHKLHILNDTKPGPADCNKLTLQRVHEHNPERALTVVNMAYINGFGYHMVE
jgi:hypothetical protein